MLDLSKSGKVKLFIILIIKMSSIDCIKDHGNNCVKSGRCPEGSSCCVEKVENGKPKLGLCVKNGYCNRNTGLPRSDCRDAEKTPKLIQEDFITTPFSSREGYDDKDCNCREWDNALWIMFLIVLLLLFFGISLKVCGKKSL